MTKSRYFRNMLVTFGSAVGLLIAFQTFGLRFIYSLSHFVVWFVWLVNFLVFLFILKNIFPFIKIRSVMDGVWGGIVIYILAPIVKLPWETNTTAAISATVVYVIFGLIVVFLGYIFRYRE